MRVLIAHRSSTSRAALAEAVPRDGQTPPEIIESADGHEALEMPLGEDPPALAVVDWDLPAVDGPELCRLVRDFHLSSPPYIVVLAGATHSDTYDAFGAGADDCVRTPAPATAIHERLEAGVVAARERQADDERRLPCARRSKPSAPATPTAWTSSASRAPRSGSASAVGWMTIPRRRWSGRTARRCSRRSTSSSEAARAGVPQPPALRGGTAEGWAAAALPGLAAARP